MFKPLKYNSRKYSLNFGTISTLPTRSKT